MTLFTIAVCLLVHVGTLHSGHTQQLTVKQVCILACVQNRSSQLQVKILLCINILTHILFSYLLHTVEYQPSNFHDDRQTVLVQNSAETVTSSILLYVNLNSQHIRDNRSIIAHLEIKPYLNQPAEVFFTQPDGTLNSTVDIVLSSSLDFSYCYDQFRNMNHTLYSVPIVVIPHPFGPANHQHTIWLTHHSPNDNGLYLLYWYSTWRESLDLFVNKTGTYIRIYVWPAGVLSVCLNAIYLSHSTGTHVLTVAVGVPVGLVGGVVIITAVVIASVVGYGMCVCVCVCCVCVCVCVCMCVCVCVHVLCVHVCVCV